MTRMLVLRKENCKLHWNSGIALTQLMRVNTQSSEGNTNLRDGVARPRRERVTPKRDDYLSRVADKKSYINRTKNAGKVDAINSRSRTSSHIENVVRASGQTSTNTAIKATPCANSFF